MSKALEPAKQNGTLFADSIRASSLDRLHQQAGQKTAPDQSQHVNLPLATREPSTEDIMVDGTLVSYGPTAEMHDRSQDAETVLAALRMTSRTTLGFDSMGT